MNKLNPSSSVARRPARPLRLVAVAAVLAGAAMGALAQYKIVGPDGKVTYTDKPPSPADIRVGGNGAVPAPVGGAAGVPYETRQAMTRYPVTLYAGKGCGACDGARDWLRQHAVPFNEYSLNTDADVLALQQRFGDTRTPVITIGGQTIKGFAPADLQSYIDAAGYPKQARLVGYNWPPAAPLAPRSAPVPAPVATAAPSAPATPSPPPASNGIQF